MENLILKQKEQIWNDFGEKLVEDSSGKVKLFYKVIKALTSNGNH